MHISGDELLNGGVINQAISDELTYDTLHSSEDNLWSALLMTGYITKSDPEEDDKSRNMIGSFIFSFCTRQTHPKVPLFLERRIMENNEEKYSVG